MSIDSLPASFLLHTFIYLQGFETFCTTICGHIGSFCYQYVIILTWINFKWMEATAVIKVYLIVILLSASIEIPSFIYIWTDFSVYQQWNFNDDYFINIDGFRWEGILFLYYFYCRNMKLLAVAEILNSVEWKASTNIGMWISLILYHSTNFKWMVEWRRISCELFLINKLLIFCFVFPNG